MTVELKKNWKTQSRRFCILYIKRLFKSTFYLNNDWRKKNDNLKFIELQENNQLKAEKRRSLKHSTLSQIIRNKNIFDPEKFAF